MFKCKVHTTEFVLASDLFNGLRKLWGEFVTSSPEFSWGGNNRSLVCGIDIINHMDNSAIENEKQMEALRQRVDDLGGQVYVDLEN